MRIADASCAWLTTLRPDGSPHTTPVWFVVVDDIFWVASSSVSVKVANILGDPRVSLAVDGSADRPHVAQGRATVHRSMTHLPEPVALLAEKYDGWDATDPAQDGPMVLLEVPVERWLLGGG